MEPRPVLPPRLLDAASAAAYLGLPAHTFRRLRIGEVRLGVRLLYDRHALDTWVDGLSGLDSGRGASSSDGSAEAALARFQAQFQPREPRAPPHAPRRP